MPCPICDPWECCASEKEFYVDQNVSIKCREGFLSGARVIITRNPDLDVDADKCQMWK